MTKFQYTAIDLSPTGYLPRLPFLLHYAERTVEVTGLLDTGSTVNVLPYRIGVALGAVWEQQTIAVPLVGSLGQFEAKALVVAATHPQITDQTPVKLVFAWTQAENVPVIFGQMNFFLEFDVCFYRSQNEFEVRLKNGNRP